MSFHFKTYLLVLSDTAFGRGADWCSQVYTSKTILFYSSNATTDSQLICLLSNYIPSFQEWNISSMNSLPYNGWIVFTHTQASPNPQGTQTKVLAVLSHESGCSSFHSLLAFTGKHVQLLAIEEGRGWGPKGYRCHCFLSSHEPVNIPCWH